MTAPTPRRAARRPLAAVAAALLASGAAPTALLAQPTGPSFPPPGGVTYTHNGALPGSSTGRVNQYTGFNTAGLNQLFWAFGSPIANPRHSSQAATGAMAYQGFSSSTGIATWTSTANVSYASPSGTQSYATRLRLQFQPHGTAGSAPLLSGWLTPTTAAAAGITSLPAAWPAFAVKNGAGAPTSFQVWYRFETASGQALLPYYDGTPKFAGGQIVTSVGGGFYATAAPEPGTIVLLAGGLALVAVGARRRRPA